MNIGGVQPLPTEQTIQAAGKSTDELWDTISKTLSALDLDLEFNAEEKTALGFAKENVWSRAARRKQARANAGGSKGVEMEEMQGGADENGEELESPLGFRVTASEGSVCTRWLEGMDSRLFESFAGMLNRAIHPR